ncbi:SDR family NAD(P)-dependent oxidoreductase [Kamptonema sp. PCC 6506]|uniref:SDR family NAD(P)-dependent oxidoreductase n=1 Tax=Kamptonema sp. PCC 6506 TaxID=272129 RepID=UPI0001DAC3DE|nr:SDR family NAD(P)-dependent oxidoreductase [Kamptonema sp. PCC 6506]CBN55407.1 Oxidoreductase, short chain dehydrogenase/reductase family [Kamptonema sp. PCC 6506]
MNQVKNQKVCIVTGGNSGIGLMTAVGLAKLGNRVFIGCRSIAKATIAVDYIRQKSGNPQVEFLPLDLSSLDSVRRFVDLFLSKQLPLQILVNNAGIFNNSGTTKEGFEMIWGTNYLGHFLLTYLLLENLKNSATSRIVMVASDLALRPTAINWDSLVKKTPLNFLQLYAVSKLCLLLLTAELGRRLSDTNVSVNAVHPGFVQSNITFGHRLSRYLGLGVSLKDGAAGVILTAIDPIFEGVSGRFYDRKGKEIMLPDLAKDTELAKELWERSLLWTGGNSQENKVSRVRENDSNISLPYSLALNQVEIAEIAKITLQNILPKPPKKLLIVSFFRLLFKLEFGSLLLLLIQTIKKEFHMERHLDSPAILALCQDTILLQKLKEYLGEELILWRSEIWANYPSQQLIPFWHRDSYPKLLEGVGKSINVYIALTEVNESNGFEYIPTAIMSNELSIKVTDPFSGNNFFDIGSDLEKQALPVVLHPGEFVIFTEDLVHRSLRNTSGKVRLSLTLRVTQPGMKILSGYSPFYKRPVLLLTVLLLTANC